MPYTRLGGASARMRVQMHFSLNLEKLFGFQDFAELKTQKFSVFVSELTPFLTFPV